jgi:hypothetical protein
MLQTGFARKVSGFSDSICSAEGARVRVIVLRAIVSPLAGWRYKCVLWVVMGNTGKRAHDTMLRALIVLAVGVGWLGTHGCGVDSRRLTTVQSEQPGAAGSGGGASMSPPAMIAAPGITPVPLDTDAGGAAATTCTPGEPALQCAEVLCPKDDVCRDFAALIPAGTCTPEGHCPTPADCQPTWTAVARGGEACVCGDTGCTLKLVEPCRAAADCQSAACAATALGANICCAAACADSEVCTEDGAGCVPAAVCAEGERRCSGANYQRCAAGKWATETVCGEVGCSLVVGGCLARVGQACDTNDQCGEGACLPTPGGVSICCTAPCDVACRACDITGLECVSLDDDAACGVTACPADSTCRNYPASTSSGRCVNGRCGAGAEVCDFEPRGEGQECSANTLCDGNGDCSVALSALGDACNSGNQCASGSCVDGVCCNQDCNGVCETCAVTGLCRAPASDPACPSALCSQFDPNCVGQSSDIDAPGCRAQGQCRGVEACEFEPSGTGCNGGINGIGTCNGQGVCIREVIDDGPTSSDP